MIGLAQGSVSGHRLLTLVIIISSAVNYTISVISKVFVLIRPQNRFRPHAVIVAFDSFNEVTTSRTLRAATDNAAVTAVCDTPTRIH